MTPMESNLTRTESQYLTCSLESNLTLRNLMCKACVYSSQVDVSQGPTYIIDNVRIMMGSGMMDVLQRKI